MQNDIFIRNKDDKMTRLIIISYLKIMCNYVTIIGAKKHNDAIMMFYEH